MRPVSNARSVQPAEAPDDEVDVHLGNPGSVMKFFTPDLFVHFDSADEVGDRADEEWGAAVRAYHKHLDEVGDKLLEARTCMSC
jgi:hypothetical protein